jgi:hypothetical protein
LNCGGKEGGVGGESLEEFEVGSEQKEGEWGSGGSGLDVLDKLAADVGLIGDGGVEVVEEQDVDGAAGGILGKVAVDVGRERDAGDGGGGEGAVLVEGNYGLFLAVFKEVESGLGEAVDGFAVIVDDDVNEDEVGAGVEDGAGGWGFRGWGLRGGEVGGEGGENCDGEG